MTGARRVFGKAEGAPVIVIFDSWGTDDAGQCGADSRLRISESGVPAARRSLQGNADRRMLFPREVGVVAILLWAV